MTQTSASVELPRGAAGRQAGRHVLGLQGLFYALTGVWPLLHIRSFMMVTGPKTDVWLVKTLSLLICAVAGTLLSATLRRPASPEAGLLAASSAATLGAAELYYVGKGTISRIYLVDAMFEIALALYWLRRLIRRSSVNRGRSANSDPEPAIARHSEIGPLPYTNYGH
jgi:hypothetical protein